MKCLNKRRRVKVENRGVPILNKNRKPKPPVPLRRY
jgi:hypothetical protein